MNKREKKWLKTIEACSGNTSGMYTGLNCKIAPNKTAVSLERGGLIRRFVPHNSAHNERWIITEEGRRSLKQD